MSEKYKSREERKTATKNTKKQKKKKRNILKQIFLTLIILGIIGIVAGATTFFVLAKDAPPLDEALLKDPLSSKVLDKNGDKIYEFGVEKRTYVSIDEIPEDMKNAVIAIEDARFYEHHGLDIIRLVGAVIANFQEGFGAEGASTISQQVIKNSFLSPEKKLKRKAQELWLAFQLENKYSKNQILEMYLNKIYYGVGNTHGVAKAAEIYFGKSLSELELHEAALIAGLGQNPGMHNPFTNPDGAENRRNVVLNQMANHGFITSEEAATAKIVPLEESLVDAQPEAQPIEAFLDQVKLEIAELGDIDVYTAGLTIHTSFDPEAQSYIDELLNSNKVIEYANDEVQAGIALTNTKTGEILALGGGRNQSETKRRNFALESSNQPGSTIKPILDYAPAMEYLNWSTYEQIVDEPYTYSDGTPINNYNQKHLGQISLRTALADSRNIPALKALQQVGLERAREFAVSLGIPMEEQIFEPYAIGGTRSGISPLQMAGAYGAFGNAGMYIKPHAVNRVVYADDTEVKTAPSPEAVMKDSTAFMITDVMKSVLLPGGTGRAAYVPGLNIAGKTGTTNYSKEDREKYNISSKAVPDSWFSGYTPNYSIAIWTGYADNKQGLVGSEQKIPQILFKSLITYLTEDEEKPDFDVPNSVVKVAVEKGSNPAKLASEFTPKDQIVSEYFHKGTEPTQQSDRYMKLDPPTDININYDENTNQITLSWSYPKNSANVSFEIRESIDEGSYKVIGTTKELKYTINNPIPEAIYRYEIVAVSDENKENRSQAGLQEIVIPAKPEDEIEITPPDGEEEEPQNEDENPDDSDQDENDDSNEDGIPDIIVPPGGTNDEQTGENSQ
ncbi:transglycosylase domain-containing protein [Litchfieldia salsa]|uniref:Penicillin-binding protein 1A n=1 Tax=Litchfieldia salsa TaxID=930152 RepID=A0A1H0TKC1_9BACI|nr:PBP1A family penicillin-binding protein [Litchfieldia salsa]SDP54271.1 penicillin-binding protein 1A [Litchfieldia salsa]